MPVILFNDHLVDAATLREQSRLLQEIASQGINSKQVTKLRGISYKGEQAPNQPVYRAKINDKERIVYTYITHKGAPTLLVLSVMKDHDYNKLSRQLNGVAHYMQYFQQEDDIADKEIDSKHIATQQKEQEPTYIPVTCYNNMHLQLDEGQNKALVLETPLTLLGPPGSGKTAVVYTLMLKALRSIRALLRVAEEAHASAAFPAGLSATPKPVASAAPLHLVSAATMTSVGSGGVEGLKPQVLFISPSRRLLTTLEKTYKEANDLPVRFSTWEELLIAHYHLKLVGPTVFAQHFAKSFAEEDSKRVHFELSLLIALGEEHYRKLGQRQSHFSNQKDKQDMVVKICAQWEHYLQKERLIDPQTTTLPATTTKYITFCDETQNLPPTALLSLIRNTRDNKFVACLDTEQCMATSPFIHNCLDALLFQYFGKNTNEHFLSQTWRCPPAIVDVANHLMNAKHQLDQATKNKRPYPFITAKHQDPHGLVSWVERAHYDKLKPLGRKPTTVVIVSTEPTDEVRKLIKDQFACENVLTAEQAIGLDFSVVILWKPLSNGPLVPLSKKRHYGSPLTSEQWYGLNALFVAITRTQSSLFICDERQNNYTQQLIGQIPQNQFNVDIAQTSAEQTKEQWEALIQRHIELGNLPVASELMNNLGLSPEELQKRRAALTNVPPKPTPQDVKSQPEQSPSVSTKSNKKQAAADNLEIRRLLAKPSIEKLEKLFRNEDRAAYLLFEHKLPDNDNLIYALFRLRHAAKGTQFRLKLLQLLTTYLTKERLNNMLLKSQNEPISIFRWFLYRVDGHKLLLELLETQRDFAMRVDVAALCSPDKKGVLPLHFFLKYIEGVEIFEILLDKTQLATTITPEALCSCIDQKTGFASLLDNSSLLLYLTFKPAIPILLKLITKNPQLAKGITGEVLCRLEKVNNLSPLDLLTGSVLSISILHRLLVINPKLAMEITAEALCCFKVKNSVFSCLATYGEGVAFLEDLLNANPALIKKITSANLYTPIPSAIGKDISPVCYILRNDKGQAFFKKLLENNPNLAKGVTAEMLFFMDPGIKGDAAVYSLLMRPVGVAILNILLDANPGLARQIYSASLDFVNKKPEIKHLLETTNEGQSLYKKILQGASQEQIKLEEFKKSLVNLTKNEIQTKNESLTKLTALIKENPSLAKEITYMDLIIPNSEIKSYICPLFVLIQSPAGLEILNTLLDATPDLAMNIYSKKLVELCQVNPAKAYLSRTTIGNKVIEKITEGGRAVLNKAKGAAPKLPLTQNMSSELSAPRALLDAFGEAKPLSAKDEKSGMAEVITLDKDALEVLFKHEKVDELLFKYSNGSLYLLQNIVLESAKNETFCLNLLPLLDTYLTHERLKSIVFSDLKRSILGCFTETSAGKALLHKLLQHNPKIAERIDISILCQPNAVGVTPLAQLANDELISILVLLFEKNNKLAEQISANDLCSSTVTASPFHNLAGFLAGQTLLKSIFDKNPGIIKNIKPSLLCSSSDGKLSPVLCGLLKTNIGVVLLNGLLTAIPDLAQQIYSEELVRFCKTNPAKTFMEGTDAGREVWEKIIKGALQKQSGGVKSYKDSLKALSKSLGMFFAATPGPDSGGLSRYDSKNMS